MPRCVPLSLLLLFAGLSATTAYMPVILMHGIFSDAAHMDEIINFTQIIHPGTPILNVDLYEDLASLEKMWIQVEEVSKKVKPFMDEAKDGVNMICFSQGTLICRALLETMEDHNIHTFISISGPHGGQYGDTEYLNFWFPNFTKEHLYEIFYNPLGQDISIANYWKDPHHLNLYEQHCSFLPSLDNPSVEHKKNFLRTQQLVLIGGPDDGVITPWQSSHFGFYDENEVVVELQDQQVYTQDTFGLKTLYDNGNVSICILPGVQHVEWIKSKEMFDKCIAPWLK